MGLSAGKRLGPYEIVTPTGAGGMGEVYRARDTRLLMIKDDPAESGSACVNVVLKWFEGAKRRVPGAN